MPLPETNTNLEEYAYTICTTLSKNGCCSVSDAEQIAIAISAMMNTSGGVLEVKVDTVILGAGPCERRLKEFGSKLFRMITTEEKWIPKHLSSYVKQCCQGNSNTILFFVAKAKDLVTHCSCAYMVEYGEIKLITDHDVICRLLRECCCDDEEECPKSRTQKA